MATSQRATASRSSAPTRAARKSVARGAAQHANGESLKTLQQEPKNVSDKPQPNDVALHVPFVEHDVLVNSIRVSTAGFKAAINLEIAVACAVFIDQDGTGTQAKKELYSIYADAGYDCKVGGEGKDYKTVSRRIGYAAQFFDSLKDGLRTVVGAARDEAAIQALVNHVATKYNFRSMSDVQEASGVVPAHRQKTNTDEGGGAVQVAQPVVQSPQGGATPDINDKGVMAALQQTETERSAIKAGRREYDDPAKWMQFNYEGATLCVPVGMRTDCLADLGIKLMTAARDMHGAATVVPAVLNEVFKETQAVANH